MNPCQYISAFAALLAVPALYYPEVRALLREDAMNVKNLWMLQTAVVFSVVSIFLINSEAGMDVPVDQETLQSNIRKLEELKSLRKNIGVAGLLVLSPIIDMKAVDEWVIRNM